MKKELNIERLLGVLNYLAVDVETPKAYDYLKRIVYHIWRSKRRSDEKILTKFNNVYNIEKKNLQQKGKWNQDFDYFHKESLKGRYNHNLINKTIK